MTRRSLLQTLISAAAGSVLAKLPIAGNWGKSKTEPCWEPIQRDALGDTSEEMYFKSLRHNETRYMGISVAMAEKFARFEDETFLFYQRGDV